MTSPDPRQHAALSAAFSRAIDLSPLKNRPGPNAGPSGAAGPDDAVGPADTTDPADRSPYVIDVTEEIFGAIVEKSNDVLVIVDLWATWCEPCKQLSPVLERLVDSYQGAVLLAKVDVDANPRVAQAFQVKSIPTVVALAQGQPVDAFSGAQPEPQLRAWMDSLLESLRPQLPGIAAAEAAAGGTAEPAAEEVEDPRFTAAQDAIEVGDYDAAIAAYQLILDAEPANAEVLAAVAQVSFMQNVEKLPTDIVALADAEPDNLTAQLGAADFSLYAGDAEAAFSRLIDAVRRTSDPERSAAREHLIELFALVGTDDPRVVKARRALAAALY